MTGLLHRFTHRAQQGSDVRPRRFRKLVVTPLLLLVGALALGGCRLPTFGAYRGKTVQAQEEFKLWSGTVIAGLVVTAIVAALILYAVARYRRRSPGDIPKQFHEHIPLEITYTIIPVVIVAFLFWFTVLSENEIDAVTSHPNEVVNVMGYRWGWRFTYEDGAGHPQNVLIQTAAEPKLLAQPATSKQYPQLVLPNDATIRIVLTSEDVIHGFYVPEFNFSRYAQPGVTNTFDFTTNAMGVFRGQCTQYCGLYHAEMLFSVRVESQANFDKWLSSQQAQQAASGLGAAS